MITGIIFDFGGGFNIFKAALFEGQP